MGDLIEDPERLETPEPFIASGKLHGRIIRTDHFGNLITNLGRENVRGFLGKAAPVIRVGAAQLREISLTYSSVPEGELLALFGSSGLLEIAVNGGSAAACLNPEDLQVIIEKN
jgi:S-adenosylmethionine hydrolase